MGCCYGLGILAHHMGGRVGKGLYGEPIGGVDCTVTEAGAKDPLLKACQPGSARWWATRRRWKPCPRASRFWSSSAPCPVQMVRTGSNVYATQFHPEANGETFATRIRIYNGLWLFRPRRCRGG
jgi:GMP synthase (glutamine-hydrolysing)